MKKILLISLVLSSALNAAPTSFDFKDPAFHPFYKKFKPESIDAGSESRIFAFHGDAKKLCVWKIPL